MAAGVAVRVIRSTGRAEIQGSLRQGEEDQVAHHDGARGDTAIGHEPLSKRLAATAGDALELALDAFYPEGN